MKHVKILLLPICFLLLYGCEHKYKDDTYLATVAYFHLKTLTLSQYTLRVEVKDNKLVKIFWSNGGWLDDTHFIPPVLKDGKASFTSDRGFSYQVEIIENAEGYVLSENSKSEDELIEEERAKYCPQCGDYKDIHKQLCYDCTNKQQDVYVYGFVDYKVYRLIYNAELAKLGITPYENTAVEEGRACSKVFKIKRVDTAKFKQDFFSSHSVQSEFNTYTADPKTVEIRIFSSMEDASNSLYKESDKVLDYRYYGF